jgi:hypothetical protein
MAHFPFFWRVWQKFEIYGTFEKGMLFSSSANEPNMSCRRCIAISLSDTRVARILWRGVLLPSSKMPTAIHNAELC